MSLAEKCINTIFKSATGSRRWRNFVTPLGGVAFTIFVTAVILLGFLLDLVLNFPIIFSYPVNLIIGLPIIIAGVLLSGYCIYYFIRSKGTPVPLNPSPKLVDKGPYAYIRNPMLTGAFTQIFGFGILCNSLSLAFIITPLFIFLNFIELKKIEEPELEKRLGEEYIEYKKRVPMFFPWGKRKDNFL